MAPKKFLLLIIAFLVTPAFARARGHDTRTIENLRKAAVDEAHAAHRYDVFAVRADEEGYPQVAKLFRAAAISERIHRRNHEAVLRELGYRPPHVQQQAVNVLSTRENLLVPIRGEREESTVMYPRLIRQAERDGVPAAARSFQYARDAERGHERLFRDALDQLGHNPSADYLVQAETGVLTKTRATARPVTEGRPLARAQQPQRR